MTTIYAKMALPETWSSNGRLVWCLIKADGWQRFEWREEWRNDQTGEVRYQTPPVMEIDEAGHVIK